jgi:hypothetical protein
MLRGSCGSGSLLPLLAALCTGCVGIHTKTPEGAAVTMDPKRFGEYVEQVFRHHNAVVNELLFLPNSADGGDSPLEKAEARMAYACLPINEVVSASALGQSTGFWSRMTLSQAVPECETATRQVERLIHSTR